MRPRQRSSFPRFLPVAIAAVIAPALAGPGLGTGVARAAQFTEEFRLQDCSWSSRGNNAFMSLRPRYQLVLEGDDDGEFARVEITVLHQTERITLEIAGVERTLRTRVVEEREFVDGELEEVSRNFFARCRETDAIYYFGEDVDIYEDGEIVSHDGAWRAGVDGARPGLIMPGTFLLGARYYQEIAPGVAEDRGKHVDMGLEVATPAGTFSDCVAVLDSDALDPDEGDLKLYCPGVGLVVDEALVLVDFGLVTP